MNYAKLIFTLILVGFPSLSQASRIGKATQFLIQIHYTTKEEATFNLSQYQQSLRNIESNINFKETDRYASAATTLNHLQAELNDNAEFLSNLGLEKEVNAIQGVIEKAKMAAKRKDEPELSKHARNGSLKITQLMNEITGAAQ